VNGTTTPATAPAAAQPSARPPRDPRRSLIIGSVIAGIVLFVLALAVLAGALLVMWPRRADRDSLGRASTPPAAVAIHQRGRANS
jgi:hypothetical protein